MPELPEVETIRRDLLPRLRGKSITAVDIRPDPRGCRLLRRYPSHRAFRRRVAGRTITAIRRRAKYLLFFLGSENGDILIIHLGMSGRLALLPGTGPLHPHTRAVFRLSGGERLCFSDPRKFGELYLYSERRGETAVNPFRLGPEPLEGSFNPAALGRILRRRNRPVKSALLDQEAVAGLGNIYADEALHRAGIHPLRKSAKLTPGEVGRLHTAIRRVLRGAVAARGTTADDGGYLDGTGRRGRFQSRLRVYQRKGEACRKCGKRIETVKIAGRTSHFCPGCQKK